MLMFGCWQLFKTQTAVNTSALITKWAQTKPPAWEAAGYICLVVVFSDSTLTVCTVVWLCICIGGIYSQPPASPSTQEAIQGMLSMANLSSSESLQQSWSNNQSKNSSQSKNNSHSSQVCKKLSGGASSNSSKRPVKRLPKKPRKSSSMESLDYDDEQDHMDACFKDSDYGKLGTIRFCSFIVWPSGKLRDQLLSITMQSAVS